jgi:hypothetical protein
MKPTFRMIRDFDIIKKINYDLSITKGSRRLKFLQTILPFAKYPLYNKASDIAGITFIASSLMEARAPSHISKLMPIRNIAKSYASNSSCHSSDQDDTDLRGNKKRRKIKAKKDSILSKKTSLSFFENFNNRKSKSHLSKDLFR